MQSNPFFSLEQIIDRQPLIVTSNTPLSRVINLMQQRGNSCKVDSSKNTTDNSSCVLIVENNWLLGIFTERDLVKLIATNTNLAEVAIAEVMTEDVVALTHTGLEDIFTALNLLRLHRVRHLPVVDPDNNLLGLITVKNLRQKLQPVNMMKWRKVAEVMKAEVIYAHPHSSVRQVAKLMAENRVSCVAIGETKEATDLVRPLGIITERDIVQFQNLNLDLEQPARELMSAPLFLVSPQDSLWTVHQQMQRYRVRRLLVGGTSGELLGIVTQTSLLQVFDPTEMYGVIESLRQQVCQLELTKTRLLENRQVELETEVRERTFALRKANRQGIAIAELDQYALVTIDLSLILQRAVYLASNILEVEYCKVLKLLPDDTFFLEAGVGWQTGLVGTAILKIEKSSQAGYALLQSQPVVIKDLRSESFEGSSLLTDHRVISGMSVMITDGGRPYGVLGTYTTRQRIFSQDDVNFLSAIAHIIARANERLQAETALKANEQRFDSILGSLNEIVWSADARTLKPIYINQAAENIYGRSVAEFYQDDNLWLEVVHPEDRDRVSKFPQMIIEKGSCEMEYRILHPDGEIRWLLVNGNLARDEDNKPLRFDGNSTDITQRKQAELEIRKFVSLADNSSDFIGMCDLNFVPFYLNEAGKQLLGLNSLKQYREVLVEDFFFSEDRNFILQEFFPRVLHEGQGEVEIRFRHFQTGEAVWMIYNVHSIEDENGRPIALATISRDISDRKRRERILQDIASGVSVEVGENFFFSLVEFLSKTLEVNFAFVSKLTGSEVQSLETLAVYGNGENIDNFVYSLANAPCSRVIERGLCFYPASVRQLFSNALPLKAMQAESYAGMPIFDAAGNVLGLVAVVDTQPFVDTTLIEEVLKIFATRASTELERQQADEKIRQQAALLDIVNDAIMVRDSDDRILFWNRGAEKLYGWSKAEALNRNAKELFNRKSTVELSKIHRAVKERGEWQGELNQVTKADKEIVVNSRWTPVKDEVGNPRAYLVVKTDITEQKQLEAQFLRTQRLESLGTLASGIAHDLNNILTPILGFAKLLPSKLPDVDEQTKGFFKIMETSAKRGAALVKQILTFSRGLEGERGIVQISHLIDEIKQIITETFPKAIELSIDASETLWTVNADINQLHQVLMNLCVNARDAMPDGGKLTIKAENFTINPEYARLHLDAELGSYVKITVTDTGVGIPPEIIDRIFEPFFTTKEIGHGTGLGLSTVIGIIKSHGGFVDVTSKTTGKRGSEISVFIPASDTTAAIAKEDNSLPQGNGELILIVDDETSILEVTKATLETYNYRVITANNGIEAVATYANNKDKIALVITDIMMSGMDGKTVIRTLKQINPELDIIAMSGLVSSKKIITELDTKVTAFISKPCDNDDLLRKIAKIIGS